MINGEKKLIVFYNTYTALLWPLSIFLMGFWYAETENLFAHDMAGLAAIAALVFAPEVIFGLDWKLGKTFSIISSIVWFLLLCKVIQYLFAVKTEAPVTLFCSIFIAVTGLIWSVLMEVNRDLRRHILLFPRKEWLEPHSIHNKYQTFSSVGVVLTVIYWLIALWGELFDTIAKLAIVMSLLALLGTLIPLFRRDVNQWEEETFLRRFGTVFIGPFFFIVAAVLISQKAF